MYKSEQFSSLHSLNCLFGIAYTQGEGFKDAISQWMSSPLGCVGIGGLFV